MVRKARAARPRMATMIQAARSHPLRRLGIVLPGLLLVCLLTVTVAPGAPPDTPTLRLASPLTLAECIRLALEKQPAVAARRASVKAAEEYCQSVADRKMGLLTGDLPVRRRQAPLGLQFVQAGLRQTECDITLAVTRAYLTVLHIRRRQDIFHQAVDDLQQRLDWLRQEHNRGSRPELGPRNLQQLATYLSLAQARQQEADQGLPRALTTLRETLGVAPDFALDIPNTPLLMPTVQVNREEILSLAQSGRPELIQAMHLAEITGLEVEAQGELRRINTKTFVACMDFHAPPPPAGAAPQSKPIVINPEMPGHLLGTRCARMERIKAYRVRADELVQNLRNQVTLEADDAFLKWQEEARKLAHFRQTAEQAARAVASADRDFAQQTATVTYDDVLAAVVLATQLQARSAESLFLYAASLAELQRVTGGGFNPCLEPPAADLASRPALFYSAEKPPK